MPKTNLILIVGVVLILASINGCAVADTPPEQLTATPESQATPQTPSETPEVRLERNDWSTIWIENANQSAQTRILLVGDSITEGYYSRVKEILQDEYYLARYTTSKFVSNPDFQTELTTILERYDFEIILLNNGLHGWDYSLEDYRSGLMDLVQILEEYAPEAELIWCQTTPIRLEEDLDYLDPLNQRVIDRNRSADNILGAADIAILDLYQEMLPHPEYYREDGLHFNNEGRSAQAELITDFILDQR